ncbi:MAG: carboxypeptidase-like regulatory domain-containing protein [Phycisphaerales bacterium]
MTRGNRILSTLVLLGLLTPGFARPARAQTGDKQTFTISGSTGLAGVRMAGLPGNVVTDENGEYQTEVPRSWKGKATPMKEGFSFIPPSRTYEAVGKNLRNQDYTAVLIMFRISGTTGVSGVKMMGLPQEVVTDSRGEYSATVPYGWAGEVKPVKPGYGFTPPYFEYLPLHENSSNQDYTTRVLEFTISGIVGVPGVTMRGFPGSPVVTDSNGKYSVLLQAGWSGAVVPEKEGYRFEPATRTYVPLERDMMNEGYAAEVATVAISGRTGIGGVLMKGLPGEPVADQEGFYKAQVPFGWGGVVVPRKEGFSFTPPERTYRSVKAALDAENYAPDGRMVTISNVIKAGREPVPGVKVTAQPGGYTAVTDSQGRYSLKVPYGWTGTLEFSKPGFDFVAEVLHFNVTADAIDEKSALPEGEWPAYPSEPSQGGAVAAGDVLVIPTGELAAERIAETTEDLRVMLQILREKLSEPRMIRGVLRDYGSLLGEDRRAEAIYLEGSAALFVIGADFPPSSPAQQPGGGESQARSQDEAADPVWQRARQKLHSPAGVGSAGQSAQIQAMTFDQFKEELLRSLKHAANIRNVDPNELVVLTIVAQKGDASRTADADMMRQYHNIYGNDDYMATLGLGRPARSTTVLTMQAKKSDIDAFAQGALDFDQLRRKVKSFSY